MLPAGIQTVLLPYLLAIELNQSPARFGLSQMIGQLPILMFLLVGGWLADKVGARRLLMTLHLMALLMPLWLAYGLWTKQITEGLVLAYAVAWGLVSAFVMPARDGLLKQVAGSDIQRLVSLAIGTQFASQMCGQALGGLAAKYDSLGILVVQCLVLLLGVWVAAHLPGHSSRKQMPGEATAKPEAIRREIVGGLSAIFSSSAMRATFLITIGMGVFFGGVFVVYIPLAIRDLYGGSAQNIAIAFLFFGFGTLTSIALLMRRGGLRQPGRALLISQVMGCLALTPILLSPPVWAFYLCIFVWGMSGGVAVTMSRTILQEHAPASHQARVMAVLSLSTVGGSPIGAPIMGYAATFLTVRWAVLVPIVAVSLITMAVSFTHSLWWLKSKSHSSSSNEAPAQPVQERRH